MLLLVCVTLLTGNPQSEMALSCDDVLNKSDGEAKDSAEAEYSLLLIECLRVLIEGERSDCSLWRLCILKIYKFENGLGIDKKY